MRTVNRRAVMAGVLAGALAGVERLSPALAKDTEWEGPIQGLQVTWDNEYWEFSVGTTEESMDWISIQGVGANPAIVFHAEYVEISADFDEDFEDNALALLGEYDQGDLDTQPAIHDWDDDDAIGYLFDRSFTDEPAYMCVELSKVDIDGYALFTFFAIDGTEFDEEETADALRSITVNGHDPFVGVSVRKVIREIANDLGDR